MPEDPDTGHTEGLAEGGEVPRAKSSHLSRHRKPKATAKASGKQGLEPNSGQAEEGPHEQ